MRNFAIAIFIGALVGLEREKRDAVDPMHRIGGIRTFTLFAMTGALSAWLGILAGTPWIFLGAILAVSGLVLAGYVVLIHTHRVSAGLTTEVAAIVVTLLGGVSVYGQPGVAVALGILVSAVLAFKRPLHQLVARVGEDDLFAGLKLLIASFIVLPLLPDRALDPLGVLNPYTLWLLVILISGLSLVGYIAVRMLGTGRGTAITGAVGGLVSSTAVTLSFAKRSRENVGESDAPDLGNALAAGILLAWAVMFIRVLILTMIVAPAMAPSLSGPLVLLGVLCLGAALFSLRHRGRSPSTTNPMHLRNPFSLTAAIKVAVFFAAVLMVVELVARYLPSGGMYLVAAIAGLTDTDAIALSLAQRVQNGAAITLSVKALVVATISNTVVKAGLVSFLGTPQLRRTIGVATALVLTGGVSAVLLL